MPIPVCMEILLRTILSYSPQHLKNILSDFNEICCFSSLYNIVLTWYRAYLLLLNKKKPQLIYQLAFTEISLKLHFNYQQCVKFWNYIYETFTDWPYSLKYENLKEKLTLSQSANVSTNDLNHDVLYILT